VGNAIKTFVLGALCLMLPSCGPKPIPHAAENWASYEGGAAGAHYSSLDQINRDNVHQLEVAWTYELGEGAALSNPIIIDGRMYVVGGQASIVALDAATGAELWKRPSVVSEFARGLMYWASGNDRRILYTHENRLRAVNAHDGADIADFEVDLRVGLEREVDSIRRVQSGTPGRIFGDLVILGSSVGENYGSPVGDIRAFNVRTGALVWTFHTIPVRGEPGYETWPDNNPRERHGGANAWAGMSIDEERGILYANTG
jgi:quinoprotein glucose dehydrogenase